MKGGTNMLSKKDCKQFLRIVKEVDVIKLNAILKQYDISQPAISKFINSDNYDDFISLDKVITLCQVIYNTSGFISDMYREIVLDEKIA